MSSEDCLKAFPVFCGVDRCPNPVMVGQSVGENALLLVFTCALHASPAALEYVATSFPRE